MSKTTARAIPAVERLRTTASALRHRNYRFYWLGHLFSVLAQNMEFVAQSWLVLELTDSPLLLGVTGLTQSIPSITLTLLGGVMADRMDRRRIMIASQAMSAFMFFALAALIVTGQVRLWQVLFFAFATGCVKAFDRPSRMALVPQTVPKEDIANAVALGGTIWQLNRLVGPAVAGILIYLAGVGATYFVCFLASILSVGMWLLIRLDRRTFTGSAGGLLKHMMGGLNFIRKNEMFYTFIGMTFFNSVFGMSYLILMPVFARDVLEVGSQGYGFLQSTGGAGALAGTLMVAYLSHSPRKVLHATVGATAFGVLLMAFAFSPWFLLSLAVTFALGVSSQFYMTTINTLLQVNLPEHLRGRVMGIYGLTWDLMPVGGTIAGTIAEFAGAPVAVGFGGALVAGMAVAVLLMMPGLRKWDR